ncbi:hypothetical protein [Thermodesulfitimonas autotrophica]|nr:hypothetical protein [Thermodesulfitimonas autotrophica]
MCKLLLFSALLVAALIFAASPAFASAHPPCQWVQVDADNDPSTPPVSVYGYWADLNGTQVLIVCDPKTDEPVQDQDGNGIAYVNNGGYVQAEKQVLDKYETKRALDWEHPKEIKPLQLTLLAPNVPLTLTYNLQDINAHGGLWLHSTGNCVSWGQGRGYAKLLTNNPDDWLIVLAVTNPNPFPVSGKVDAQLWRWSNLYSDWPFQKSLALALGPNETKYVLVNRSKQADLLAQKFSDCDTQGYTLAYMWASSVSAAALQDFPADIMGSAKGFGTFDIYGPSEPRWPMRFAVGVKCNVNASKWGADLEMDESGKFRTLRMWDSFYNYVWFDADGRAHLYPGSRPPYKSWWSDLYRARDVIEGWFNSHKLSQIPLIVDSRDARTVDGLYFYWCSSSSGWWPENYGAYASWTEQEGPVLVGAKPQTNFWLDWNVPKWAPVLEQNLDRYSFYWNGSIRRICGGKGTFFWGDRREWLPVFMARLCFVHRYSFIPVQGDVGVLKEDVVPGYQMWIQTERAPKLSFSHPLKKITATRYHFLGGDNGPYDYLKYLVTTWEYVPGAGWTKLSERQESYWWESTPARATWGRYYFVPYPDNSDPRSVGVTPDVWDVRVEYASVLSAASELIGGEFRNRRGSDLYLFDRAADALRGGLYNLYGVWYGWGFGNYTPAVANLSAPASKVTVPSPVRVEPKTSAPRWRQDFAASVRVARRPDEDPGAVLNAVLAAIQGSLSNCEAVFLYDPYGYDSYGCTPQFVLDPDVPVNWGNYAVPVEWIRGFGCLRDAYNWLYLGTPDTVWSNFSYFAPLNGGYVALPDDVFLNQCVREWPLRREEWNWFYEDPWLVRWWSYRSQKWIVS